MLQLFLTEDFEEARECIHVECYTIWRQLTQMKVPNGIGFDNLQDPLTQHGFLPHIHIPKCHSCQFLGF
jgi:hypothetical protein